jgi:hypothetical protein
MTRRHDNTTQDKRDDKVSLLTIGFQYTQVGKVYLGAWVSLAKKQKMPDTVSETIANTFSLNFSKSVRQVHHITPFWNGPSNLLRSSLQYAIHAF